MNWFDDYLKRLLLLLIGGAVVSIVAIIFLKPSSWGEYGNYRGDALKDEASKSMVYGDNKSCISCHKEIDALAKESTHKRLSCELCHTPLSEHVKDDKKFKDAVVVSKERQNELCLLCHKKVLGREGDFPVVDPEKHLDMLAVKPDTNCNKCHAVHAPMENINYIKSLRELREKKRVLKQEQLIEAKELEKIELEKAKELDED